MFSKFGVGFQAYVRRFINSRQFIFEWFVLQHWYLILAKKKHGEYEYRCGEGEIFCRFF